MGHGQFKIYQGEDKMVNPEGELKTASSRSYKALKAENERLKQWISDLQSGMYINCVYCGHRYGPKMADILKEHIEKCPEHPMSHLKAEYDRLRENFKIVKAFYGN